MQERFIKRLLSTIKCSVCGQRYQVANVNILGHYGELWFTSVFCPACGTQALVAAVIKEGKLAEVVTDLTEEEYAKFLDSAPVEMDDVLDIHNFLKGFGGDFSNLFTKKK